MYHPPKPPPEENKKPLAPYSAADFRKEAGLDAVTLERFEVYEKLLREWNPAINLVSETTLDDVWRRHFMDSAQLFPLIPPTAENLADMGSGAGFPGLVLAMMGAPNVYLIERDTRKAAFLRTVAAATGTKVELYNIPVKDMQQQFDVVTARALAPVEELLTMSALIRKPSSIGLFLKGKNLDPELKNAHKEWDFEARKMKSSTDDEGVVLRVSRVEKRK